MYQRSLLFSLMTSTSMVSMAYAQSVPTPQPPPQTAAVETPTTNIGEIKAKEAPKRELKQKGLTAAPTDFEAPDPTATAAEAAAATAPAEVGIGSGPPRPVTPGGVTGTDLGGGYMIKEEAKKTRSTVTRDAIDKQAASANPYQLINLLPGVVQSSTDNTGSNGGNIRLRGFNSDKIGMTIEGAPINDSGNYALFPQEYIDALNIENISIAQGSPDLDSPHIGSIGGVINIYMRDPAKEAGGLAEVSLGSDAFRRVFVRGESGQVGDARAFLSYSYLERDNWAGPGGDERHHVDFKGVWDVSEGNTIRVAALYNQAVWQFYRQPTLAQFNSPGFKPGFLATLPPSYFNQTNPVDQGANAPPAPGFPGGVPVTDYYEWRKNPFENLILSAPSNFTLAENVKFDTVPYFWYGFGNGGGVAGIRERTTGNGFNWGNLQITGVDLGPPAGVNNNNRYMYYNPSITETYRPGVINKLSFELGNHTLIVGHWFEVADHRQTAPYVALNADGSVQDDFARSNQFTLPAGAVCRITTQSGSNAGLPAGTVVACPTGPVQRRDQQTTTQTNMVFVGDSWAVTPNLNVDFGAKHVWINRDIENYLPDAKPPRASLSDSETLPTIGAQLKLDEENQIFASLATSFRSAPNFTLTSAYSNTSGAFTPINILEPETGINYEIGHRYQGSLFATAVSAFYGDYENFQQNTQLLDVASGGTVPVTQTINLGAVRNYGVNAELGTAPIYNFRGYLSGEYLRTEILDNFTASGTLGGGTVNDQLRTKGKELPGAPNYSFGVGLDYDDGHFIGNLEYKWIGEQYSTLMNDEQIDAFGRLNAMIGYRFADAAGMKAPELKLNLFNLFDANQLTGVAGIRNNATTQTGVNGATIAGAAPTYFQGEGFSALLTFRSGF